MGLDKDKIKIESLKKDENKEVEEETDEEANDKFKELREEN